MWREQVKYNVLIYNKKISQRQYVSHFVNDESSAVIYKEFSFLTI